MGTWWQSLNNGPSTAKPRTIGQQKRDRPNLRLKLGLGGFENTWCRPLQFDSSVAHVPSLNKIELEVGKVTVIFYTDGSFFGDIVVASEVFSDMI